MYTIYNICIQRSLYVCICQRLFVIIEAIKRNYTIYSFIFKAYNNLLGL